MVLPRQTGMYTSVAKPRLRAVMLQNESGSHYIYLTAEKVKGSNVHGVAIAARRGKCDFYFTVGKFPCQVFFYRPHNQLFIKNYSIKKKSKLCQQTDTAITGLNRGSFRFSKAGLNLVLFS